MKRHGDGFTFSATDLSNYLACRRLAVQDRLVAEGKRRSARREDPAVEALVQRGAEHEAAYLAWLEGAGKTVVRLSPRGWDAESVEQDAAETRAAMERRADVIYQATLYDGRWLGRADFLVRVDRASALGEWSYEIQDAKLARDTKAGTVLQLCVYADLLATIQGCMPEHVHVVPGGPESRVESYRVDSYLAYYRFVKKRFLEQLGAAEVQEVYPEPCEHCDVCDYFVECRDRRRADDHLSLVAGISRLQRTELQDRGVHEMAELARLPIPLDPKPARGNPRSYARVREQARVQVEGREHGEPIHELLEAVEEGKGFNILPEPSPGDLFFDIEGDRFAGAGGHEYLFGLVDPPQEPGGEPRYEALWALDGASEKAQFERLIDLIQARRQQYPDMHVYHYAPYEPSAVKRLMGRYGTRESEVDDMLRKHVFVDLYRVVRQGLRASVESYSIKQMEPLYGYARAVPLEGVGRTLRQFETDLELGRAEEVEPEILQRIEGYNRDDCVSTLLLRDWLEAQRAVLVERGAPVKRPVPVEDDTGDAVEERLGPTWALHDRLVDQLPADREQWTPEDTATWIVANLLFFHRRENKLEHFEFYRMCALTSEELVEERNAIGQLEHVEDVSDHEKVIHRFTAPAQDIEIGLGKQVYDAAAPKAGTWTLHAVDPEAGTVDLSYGRRAKKARSMPTAVVHKDLVPLGAIPARLMDLAEWFADPARPNDPRFGAAFDLLVRAAPRIRGRTAGALLVLPGETTLEAARRLTLELDGSVLPVQGPPGAGKTYTGARMIVAAIAAGKKIGVTSNSHHAIRTLLDEVVEAASEAGVGLRMLQKAKEADASHPVITVVKDDRPFQRERTRLDPDVMAGTAWLWARENMQQSVDVLFVDEASQMSLANVVAAASAAKSVVLLGDPQQLEQPMKGAHPDGVAVAALSHLLAGEPTIAPDRGLFLTRTHRLPPPICAMTSVLFYRGRLAPAEGLEQQRVDGPGPYVGAGLHLLEVAHEGNQNRSDEEVEAVAELCATLADGQHTWTDKDGTTQPLTPEHLLIIAPYNAQVNALKVRLPNAKVGTVDKFQGQQAPVVIYSMTTSSPTDAPRGMEFLYSLNRFNVATSRAQCICVLVASPALFEPECRSPRQMELANGVCAFRERVGE